MSECEKLTGRANVNSGSSSFAFSSPRRIGASAPAEVPYFGGQVHRFSVVVPFTGSGIDNGSVFPASPICH